MLRRGKGNTFEEYKLSFFPFSFTPRKRLTKQMFFSADGKSQKTTKKGGAT
jgi:hypothetical protein